MRVLRWGKTVMTPYGTVDIIQAQEVNAEHPHFQAILDAVKKEHVPYTVVEQYETVLEHWPK